MSELAPVQSSELLPLARRAPLSFAQERLRRIDRLHGGSPFLNLALAVDLAGEENLPALSASLAEIVRRHRVLRTAFPEADDLPVPMPAGPLPLPLADLSGLSEEHCPEALAALIREETGRAFDLAAPPLLRSLAVRLSPRRLTLLLTLHPIAADQGSFPSLAHELLALYRAASARLPFSLPEPPLQYADYAVWERETLAGEPLRAGLAFWRRQLAGAPAALDLPADRLRPAVETFRGRHVRSVLPPAVVPGLSGLSGRGVLLAAFAALLHRYSGQEDLLIGSTLDLRQGEELRGLIGCFANPLALRLQPSPELPFQRLVEQAQEAFLAACDRGGVPFGKVVEELRPDRALDRNPLFQVTLDVAEEAKGGLDAPGPGVVWRRIERDAALHDLMLTFERQGGETAVRMVYSAELFDTATAGRWSGHLSTLLEGAVTEPERRLSDLPLLTAAERQQLDRWSFGGPLAESGICVHELFAAQAARTPDRVAAVHGHEELSYGELAARAHRLAQRLRVMGVGPEAMVGLCVERSFDMIVAIFGILAAGGAYVPLDPMYPRERIAFAVADTSMAVLLTETRLLPVLPQGPALAHTEVICLDTLGDSLKGEPAPPPVSGALPANLVTLLYTSGSTGRPKAVAITHASTVSLIQWERHLHTEADFAGFLFSTSICFDLSVLEVILPLCIGGTAILAESLLDLPALPAAERVRILVAVPSVMSELLREHTLPASLHTVLLGGEPLPRSLVDQVFRQGPGVERIINVYGPSEDTTYSTCAVLDRRGYGVPTIGRPIAEGWGRVVDGRMRLMPVGMPGELLLGGAGLARGYLGRPELTAERFVPDPFSKEPGCRLYRTGDRVRLRPDGELEFLSRIDHQIKVRGFRIEPGEIEAALRALPGVREAVVLAREDAAGELRLAAYLAPTDEDLDLPAVRRALFERLPTYLVPSAFVVLASLPLTPNGKLDRRALPLPADWVARPRVEPAAAPRPHGERRAPQGIDPGVQDLLAGLSRLSARRRLLFLQQNPLSFAQERLWFLDRLHGGSAFYNGALAVDCDGRLDLPALAAALSEIVRRHQALRTAFVDLDGLPLQAQVPSRPLPLPLVDLSGLPEERRPEELGALTKLTAGCPFDLGAPPLVRSVAVRCTALRHTLVVSVHHIAADRLSLQVFARELAILYRAAFERLPSPLADLPLQYPDFAAWQRRTLGGELLEAGLAFWRKALAGAPTVLELPADRPRPPVETFRGGRVLRPLPGSVSRDLAAYCSRSQATGFMAGLAAFCVLLHRYSGQEDMLIGTASDHRSRVELEGLIGLFVNTLIMRVQPARSLPFHALLDRTRRTILAASEHDDLPFEKLVESLQPERAMSRNPLYQVVFNLVGVPTAALDLPGLEVAVRPVDRETALYDLMLTLDDRGDALVALLDYNSDLFDRATVERFLGHFERLLAGICEDDARPVGCLPILAEAERHQLLTEWMPEPPPAVRPRESLQRQLEAQAARRPDAVAARRGAQSITYRELNRWANRLAHWLLANGIGLESRVAVLGDRSLALLGTLLGLAKAGAVYVPLDPVQPAPRLSALLADCGPALVITQADRAGRVLALAAGLPGRPRVLCWDEAPDGLGVADLRDLAAQPDDDPSEGAEPQSLANIFYTSGSTGRPKGAMVEHRGMLNHLESKVELLGLDERSVVVQNASQSFDISIWQFLSALLAGGQVVVYDDAVVSDVESLLARAEQDGVTVLETVPTLLDLMLAGARPSVSLPRLTCLMSTGEALPVALCRRWCERFPHVPLVNAYGPTECSDDVAHHVFRTPPPADGLRAPVGRGIPGMGLFVLDRGFELLPPGVPGQIAVDGVGVGRGYLGDAVKTALAFMPDPFAPRPGGRLYLTGDLGRFRPDGTLEYLGRIDHQVKLRGLRVELGEIEASLDRHPAVREAIVVLRREGGGEGRLVAYTVGEPGARTSPDELRAFLREHLPEHMVPAAFVGLDALPLTPNGKVDRRALPAPAAGDEGAETDFASPRGPVQEIVAALWCEVLGRERVGLHEDFFESGGHSLLAMRMVSRARSAFGVEIPLRVLFESPTPAGLAAAVERGLKTAEDGEAPPLEPVSRTGPLPLSFAQQRLWLLAQLEPDSPAYNLPVVVRHRGLDLAAFAEALSEVVRRHEALRTAFGTHAGEPVQWVRSAAPVPLPRVDLGGLPADLRLPEARRLATAEALRPFDLATGLLLRALALILNGTQGDVAVVTTLHHVAADAWSLEIFHDELAVLHEACRRREPSPLPALPVQYGDFAVWQRRWLKGEVLEAEIAYWRERLAGLPPVLDLPADRPRPAVRSSRGGHRRVAFPPALAASLRRLARSRGSTLFMVLLAAFQTLLAKLTGRTDLAVGTPVAGRSRTEIEGLIGFFVNTLVLRTDLAGDPRFEDLLVRVRTAALGAYAHQNLPFERLVEELSPERSLSHTPLFQVMLALENVARREAAGSGVEELRIEGGIAKFDLVFAFLEGGEELQGGATYSADLFDGATVERWLGHFATLLDGVASAPELRLSELSLLSAAELRQLAAWSPGEPLEDSGLCLHELFAKQAVCTPDAVAVVCREEALSYRELAARSSRLAHHLRGLGVGPEVRVGICMERSLDMVVGMLGVLAAGGAYVPLDPTYPAERLAFTLADAATPVLLTTAALLPILPPGTGGVERVCMDTLREDLECEPAALPETGVRPGNLAYLIYTSGSTGRPKGVAISHAAAVALVRWARTLHSEAELAGVLASTSICFDLSVFELFLPLCAGGTVILARNALELASLPGAGRVTLVNTVPSAIAELVRVNALPASVRTVNLAGEPLLRDLVDRIYRCPGVERVLNLYGPSEDTTYSTFTVVPRDGRSAPTIGRPVGGGRSWVLDGNLQTLPCGIPGELFLGGRGLARGYLGRPDLTAERFVPDPFTVEPGSRLYRTGDLARYRSDGELEFLGRIDHQVKVRGFRIELGEVEAALAGFPEVRDAVVLAREDEPGDRRLVAYVVPAGEGLDASALRQALGLLLPGFMIPSAFLVLEALPLTPNGKVDRRALPSPEGAGAGRKDSRQSPLTAVEEVVAGIWEQILKLAPVGRLDNFFEIGGHSLLATRVLSRVHEAFAVEIPLRRLFEEPTPAGLAAAVESALRTREGSRPVPPVRRLPRPGELPLSFAQQRLWFAEQLEPGSTAYVLAGAVRLRGKLDVAALRGSFAEIARRHEVLRARFTDVEGRPVQSVVSELVPELPVLDLSSLPEAEREPAILRLTEAEMQPFDLARGPLLRLRLLRLGGEEHVLVLAMHHIVSDAWSLQVLLGELRTLYPALAAGRPCPLSELPVQYADFAAWQRDWMSGEVLQEHLGYWRRKLAGLQPLRLPTDHPRTEAVPRGDRRRLYLSRELREELRELGRREGATLFMTLLTGFGVVLHALSGQDDVAVGADIANRTRGETEGLIGFFINMLVLRTDLSRNPGFRALLGRVRETAFGAYAHQDLPYERLVEELQPERRSGHSPLFQVVFNFNNTQEADQAGSLGSLGAVTLTPVEVEKVTVRFELALLMREVPEGLEALWLFNGNLFEGETVERMHRRLEAVLQAAVAGPETRLNRLAEVGEEERRRREAEAREAGRRQKLRQVKAVPMKVEKI